MRTTGEGFAQAVVRWRRRHGRSGLPWQGLRDPYRVWLSEVMLQQTQVATVLGYYARFLERFPTVQALAAASEDEVYALWSGLGYYSRARNLHACARAVVQQHGGHFPQAAAGLQELPGIGRSTAAAIAAFCFGERVAILDGNVKRVLARALAFEEDIAGARAQQTLWQLAQDLVPGRGADMPDYTQGLMDLGATVCLPREPRCDACPLQPRCAAHAAGDPQRYPVKSRRLKRSSQSWWLLDARRSDGAVWLQRRPARGVWAGLYCLPAYDSYDLLAAAVDGASALQDGEPFVHVLTHKDLHLHPVHARTAADPRAEGAWFEPRCWAALGMPAPVRRLLDRG